MKHEEKKAKQLEEHDINWAEEFERNVTFVDELIKKFGTEEEKEELKNPYNLTFLQICYDGKCRRAIVRMINQAVANERKRIADETLRSIVPSKYNDINKDTAQQEMLRDFLAIINKEE